MKGYAIAITGKREKYLSSAFYKEGIKWRPLLKMPYTVVLCCGILENQERNYFSFSIKQEILLDVINRIIMI